MEADDDVWEQFEESSPSGEYYINRVKSAEWPDGYVTRGFAVYSKKIGPLVFRRTLDKARAHMMFCEDRHVRGEV